MLIIGLILLLLALLSVRWFANLDMEGDCPKCGGRGAIGCELCGSMGWVPWCLLDDDDCDAGKCHFGTSSLGLDCPNCPRKRKT